MKYLFLIFIALSIRLNALSIGVIADSIGVDSPGHESFATFLIDETACDMVKDAISCSQSHTGPSRIKKMLQENDIDYVIITLGINDYLSGLQPEQTIKNLKKTVKIANAYGVKILIGKIDFLTFSSETFSRRKYLERFNSIYQTLALENDVKFFPFLTRDIILNHTKDSVHPLSSGGYLISQEILKIIRD